MLRSGNMPLSRRLSGNSIHRFSLNRNVDSRQPAKRPRRTKIAEAKSGDREFEIDPIGNTAHGV
jgi:hypothetical protein